MPEEWSKQPWHHSPAHIFESDSIYFVTAGTYQKSKLYDSPFKLDELQRTLFCETEKWGWRLEAWAILANHYHFIARAPEDATTLAPMIRALHSKSAIWLNKIDGTPGRKVWHQFWDTCLTNDRSYWARLNYVHRNPEKHGLVGNAELYRWCSMAWFIEHADTGTRRTVLSFNAERVIIDDDY